jgi:hypothetical protein
MALSKALVQPFRKNTLLIGAGWRSFFAPYNIALGSGVANTQLGPTILDLQTQGPFNTNAPPAGWTDTGWIKNFKLTPGSKIGQVRSGYRGAVRAQYRGEVGESFEFSFREAARMQFKIAVGNTPFNLLNGSTPSTLGPLSASGAPKTAMVSYSPGPPATLTVASAAAISASGGTYIVADLDYTAANFPGQGNPPSGIVGAAGVPLQPFAVTDIDYIRKTSDFVARVTSVTTNVLTLDQPFVGGGSGLTLPAPTSPPTGSNVQTISGWAVREGATFVTEWSGLFVMDTIDAAQIAIYYPHVSIAQFKDIQAWTIENQGTTDQTGYDLDCMMNALAFDDPLDGETVVGYKAFYLRTNQAAAI